MQVRPARTTLLALPLLVLGACTQPAVQDSPEPQEPDPLPWDTGSAWTDQDEDGHSPADGDCDDTDPTVHPGQFEICDGRDENCNGVVDEGFGDADADTVADCVDSEECDGLDNDGDGEVDEGFGDADGDATADCMDPEECDGHDNDGDGEVDESFDADGDGWLPCGPAERDCDDADPGAHPGAIEQDGDGRDEDCDGLIDEGLYVAGGLLITEIMANPAQVADPAGEWVEVLNLGAQAVYLQGLTLDSGVGEAAVVSCAAGTTLAPGVYAVVASEADPRLNGGVTPTCTAGSLRLSNEGAVLTLRAGELVIDQVTWDDGATMPDENGASLSLDPTCTDPTASDEPTCWCAAPGVWAARSDLGSPGADNSLCPTLDHDGDGFTQVTGDCDDAAPFVNPGEADPWYDGLDQDCDGWSDFDADRDGFDLDYFGGTDCDDGDASVNPGMAERCDRVDLDEDCNGLADDDDPAPQGQGTYYHDRDSDGWGSDAGPWYYCDPPRFALTVSGDCDDTDPAVSPDATELCDDATDDDCDGYAQTCAEISLAAADLILEGADGDQTGSGIASAGSFGGGVGIAVGAIDYLSAHPDTGSACFVADPAGIIAGLSGTSARVALSSVATCFTGETARDQAGGALDGGWDADGDGVDDLLIGALGQRGFGPLTGAAYLVLGPGPSSGSLADAEAILHGKAAGDQTGASVAFAGDLDGDGATDLLVGSPGMDKSSSTSNVGEVCLFLGPVSGGISITSADAALSGESTGAEAGTSLAGGGDVDGDGLVDFLVGAPGDSAYRSNAGVAYVFTYAPSGSGTLYIADARLQGEQANVALGTSVAIVGDVDGDGLGDFLLGSPGDTTGGTDAGAAWLITGMPTGHVTISSAASAKLYGGAAQDAAGSTVSAAGDVDGDGFADLLVSAPGASTAASGAGEAYLVLGPVSSTLDLLADHDGWFLGEAENAGDGMQVAPAGDLDGDGMDDLLVSAPALDVSGYPDGAVYVLLAASLFPGP